MIRALVFVLVAVGVRKLVREGDVICREMTEQRNYVPEWAR